MTTHANTETVEHRSPHGGATLTQRHVPFTAGDGLELDLVNVRGPRMPTRPPVVLVHGAGMRTESWTHTPIDRTLVDMLVDEGYDVWLENWRASIHAGPNPWTLDQAAIYDHPAAIRAILADTGADEVKAIVQCMGSASFMMSAVAGLLPEVSTIISNSVSLHPVVPPAARWKARYVGPLVNRAAPYLDPNWGRHAPTHLARGLRIFVRATHRECDNPVCTMASVIYGAGRPTLWLHENLNEETHDWLGGEFGPAPRTFFDQIGRCIEVGHLVAVEGRPELPDDFVAQAPQTDARVVLLTGDRNRCFLPVGQRRSYEFLERHRPGRQSIHVLAGYSHLDVFIGVNAARDTHPIILRELN
jgi:pimeloyl-ACP methyl ester carboxylesterase